MLPMVLRLVPSILMWEPLSERRSESASNKCNRRSKNGSHIKVPPRFLMRRGWLARGRCIVRRPGATKVSHLSLSFITIKLFQKTLLILGLSFGATYTPLAQPQTPPSIILISVDTLRADHLGCYGSRGRPTPNINALTKGGTLFAQVSSQVPLTLPSHVSLFTSSYPFRNGIMDNGQQLGQGAITLASVLKSKGYRTAAFVGGFVLDRRFGLHQGFDIYDSPFHLHSQQKTDPGEVKRGGEEVVRAATEWLNQNSNGPFFAFLHLYDLHTPYELPPAKRNRYGGKVSYETQLAYIDEVLGGFLKYLTQKGLFDKSLIVFTSDHGEGLGDHGESTHGYFIYQSTLHVPLIIHWPLGTRRFPDRMAAPVRLLDVAPTIVQFAGLTRPPEFQGQSLLGVLNQKEPSATTEIYGESLYASRHFGCSDLQSLQLGRFKYIEAPKPELYDLAKDPGENQNLYASEKSMALSLRERLLAVRNRFRAEHSEKSQALSPEAVAALSSLGYVGVSSPASASSVSKPDPKDRLREFESHNRAISLASSGRLAESNRLLQQLRLKLPDVSDIPLSLGVNQQRLGLPEEAAKTFREALKTDPLNVLGHFNLALSLFELRQLDEAIKELQAVLTMAPYYTRADELLGTIWVQRRDYARARDCFNHLLKYAPEDYTAHYNLGVLATLEGKWDEGEQHLDLALAADPNSSEAHNTLGSLYLRRGELDRAREAFLKTIALDAKLVGAHYNLGLVLRQQKKNEAAAQCFRQALSLDPQFRPAREALERLEGAK
jgi:choline-sulfatase